MYLGFLDKQLEYKYTDVRFVTNIGAENDSNRGALSALKARRLKRLAYSRRGVCLDY